MAKHYYFASHHPCFPPCSHFSFLIAWVVEMPSKILMTISSFIPSLGLLVDRFHHRSCLCSEQRFILLFFAKTELICSLPSQQTGGFYYKTLISDNFPFVIVAEQLHAGCCFEQEYAKLLFLLEVGPSESFTSFG